MLKKVCVGVLPRLSDLGDDAEVAVHFEIPAPSRTNKTVWIESPAKMAISVTGCRFLDTHHVQCKCVMQHCYISRVRLNIAIFF